MLSKQIFYGNTPMFVHLKLWNIQSWILNRWNYFKTHAHQFFWRMCVCIIPILGAMPAVVLCPLFQSSHSFVSRSSALISAPASAAHLTASGPWNTKHAMLYLQRTSQRTGHTILNMQCYILGSESCFENIVSCLYTFRIVIFILQKLINYFL